MNKYTYEDVIIDPNDKRIELWEEYYFGNTPFQCLQCARTDKLKNFLKKVFKDSDKPFSYSSEGLHGFPCIIRAKSSKKYIPFDLSQPEVRDKLRGKWVRSSYSDGMTEMLLNQFYRRENKTWAVNGYSTDILLKEFVFLDGTPCGELVENEE